MSISFPRPIPAGIKPPAVFGVPGAPENVAPGAGSASPPLPAIDAKPPKLTFVQKIEEEVTDLLLLVSNFHPLRDLGYKLYGLMTKPKPTSLPLDNLGNLTPSLMRGAQPSGTGFDQLKAQGVDTVINLRPEANWEASAVAKSGMKAIYLPLPALGAPSNDQAMQFLSAITDPANGKVFFHCQHGADRTGEMAAAYRIAAQGWPADRAVAEMYDYRFHTGFQYEKELWVFAFAKYWQALPASKRAEVLHTSLAGNG